MCILGVILLPGQIWIEFSEEYGFLRLSSAVVLHDEVVLAVGRARVGEVLHEAVRKDQVIMVPVQQQAHGGLTHRILYKIYYSIAVQSFSMLRFYVLTR